MDLSSNLNGILKPPAPIAADGMTGLHSGDTSEKICQPVGPNLIPENHPKYPGSFNKSVEMAFF